MYIGTMAERFPERSALMIGDAEVVLSYRELDVRSNQVAHALRALGLAVGDTVAVMTENCEQFFEVWWAAMRTGLYLTPINWHLTAPEVEYVLDDSGARALVYSGHLDAAVEQATASHPSTHLIAVGTSELGHSRDYATLRDAQPSTRVGDEVDGSPLVYSSGTTGRPKGIRRRLTGAHPSEGKSRAATTARRFMLTEGCRYLSPGPVYHGAPSLWPAAVHAVGGTAVVMRKFDPESALRLIDGHRITDTQMVPTMLQRMLNLPAEVRDRYDVSSLVRAWTAAAPISVDVKRAVIAWWGNVLMEYYAASEGGGTMISAEEWLERPGSVGRHYTGDKIYILDPVTFEEVPPGSEGGIYFKPQPDAQFVYHNDPEKTAETHHEGMFTAGDVGYVDADGYLFLTDRKANMIISGGTNIYPREIEEAIAAHDRVEDVAVFGIPNADLGEQVHAVVQPANGAVGDDELKECILEFLASRLSRHKIPRSLEFTDALPRDDNGKLYKRILRDPYWEGRSSRLV